MKKILLTLLVVVVGLAPALVAAQGTSGSSEKPGSSSPGMGSSGSGSGSSSSGSSSSGSSSGSSATSPSASPSTGDKASDMSQHKTKATCEKAGGQWTAATSTCEKSSK